MIPEPTRGLVALYLNANTSREELLKVFLHKDEARYALVRSQFHALIMNDIDIREEWEGLTDGDFDTWGELKQYLQELHAEIFVS